jgi:hypothetical protein
MNTGNGDIQIFDAKSKEAMAIQSSMEDDESSMKTMLKNKWNSSRQTQNGENTDL